MQVASWAALLFLWAHLIYMTTPLHAVAAGGEHRWTSLSEGGCERAGISCWAHVANAATPHETPGTATAEAGRRQHYGREYGRSHDCLIEPAPVEQPATSRIADAMVAGVQLGGAVPLGTMEYRLGRPVWPPGGPRLHAVFGMFRN